MSTKTKKLKLTLPGESDPVSIGDINGNMAIIDGLVHVKESGKAPGTVSHIYGSATTPTNDGSVTWYYKKYDDGTFSAYCNYQTTDLLCNAATGPNDTAPFYSGTKIVNTPTAIGITAIKDCQIHIAGNCMNWVMNITGETILSQVKYQLASIYKEGPNSTDTRIYKQHYIHIEGTWS